MDEYLEKMDFHAAKIGTYGPEAFPVYILAAVAQLSAHRVNRSANHMLATYSQRHIDKLRSWITPHDPQSLSTRAFEIRQQLTAAQQALQAPARFIIGQGTQRQAWTREMIAEQRRADVYWRRLYGPQYHSQPLYQTLFNKTRYELVFNGFDAQRQPVIEFTNTHTGVFEASQLPSHLSAAFRTTDPLGRMMLWQSDNGNAPNNQNIQNMIAACIAPLHNRFDYSEQRVFGVVGQIRSCMERHYAQLSQSRAALEAELQPYNSTIAAIEIGIRRLNTLRTSLRLPVQNTPWHQLRYRPS